MSEKLHEEYLSYLAQYGLEPRSIPAKAVALQAEVVEHLRNQAKASGDDFVASWIEEAYEKNKERYLNETRHPSVVLIETTAAEVEQSVQAIDKYRDLLNVDVFVGEFPTGLINARVVKADSGFIVLINSGLLVSIEQIVEFLVAGDPDDPANDVANRTTIDGVVEVLKTYLRFGDPFFGPKPLSGGLTMFLVHALSQACRAFVVAHEYGHVIAGHFEGRAMQLEQLETNDGTISVIKKEWKQELEADTIAHKIVLGIDDYAQLDLAIIDEAFASDDFKSSVLARATEVKAAIAAPFVFLTIDAILADVQEALRIASSATRSDNTHPPAQKRMANLMSNFEGLAPKYTGYINFAGILWAHIDEICERLVRAMLETPGGDAETD